MAAPEGGEMTGGMGSKPGLDRGQRRRRRVAVAARTSRTAVEGSGIALPDIVMESRKMPLPAAGA